MAVRWFLDSFQWELRSSRYGCICYSLYSTRVCAFQAENFSGVNCAYCSNYYRHAILVHTAGRNVHFVVSSSGIVDHVSAEFDENGIGCIGPESGNECVDTGFMKYVIEVHLEKR